MSLNPTGADLRARVSQVAGVLGISPADVRAPDKDGETLSPTMWLRGDEVESALTGHVPRKSPDSLRGYIRAAFDAARETREDWQAMPLPVLKNRLLTLTNGDFHEWDYGWPNLRFLPRAYPEMLTLDVSTAHGMAVFVESPTLTAARDAEGSSAVATASPAPARGRRIREDLWTAVVDYRSGAAYAWDAVLGRAVEVDGTSAGSPVFPTINAATVRDWRAQCAAGWLQRNGDGDRAEVEAWVENPRERISHRLFDAWRSDQRERVIALVEEFFDENGLQLPPDAFPDVRPRTSELNARELVRLAAEVMTDSEADSLQLPVGVVIRALRFGKHIQ